MSTPKGSKRIQKDPKRMPTPTKRVELNIPKTCGTFPRAQMLCLCMNIKKIHKEIYLIPWPYSTALALASESHLSECGLCDSQCPLV